jgi:hypothetical protein
MKKLTRIALTLVTTLAATFSIFSAQAREFADTNAIDKAIAEARAVGTAETVIVGKITDLLVWKDGHASIQFSNTTNTGCDSPRRYSLGEKTDPRAERMFALALSAYELNRSVRLSFFPGICNQFTAVLLNISMLPAGATIIQPLSVQ